MGHRVGRSLGNIASEICDPSGAKASSDRLTPGHLAPVGSDWAARERLYLGDRFESFMLPILPALILLLLSGNVGADWMLGPGLGLPHGPARSIKLDDPAPAVALLQAKSLPKPNVAPALEAEETAPVLRADEATRLQDGFVHDQRSRDGPRA